MFYTMNTKNGIDIMAHETAVEAASHLISELGSDYKNDFWIENGRVCRSSRMLDFTAEVYPNAEELMKSISALDEDALPPFLHALANAIEVAA